MMGAAEIAFHSLMNQQMVVDGVKRKRNYDFVINFVKSIDLNIISGQNEKYNGQAYKATDGRNH